MRKWNPMFGKLKEKLKDALSVFSKKTEEQADVKETLTEVSKDKPADQPLKIKPDEETVKLDTPQPIIEKKEPIISKAPAVTKIPSPHISDTAPSKKHPIRKPAAAEKSPLIEKSTSIINQKQEQIVESKITVKKETLPHQASTEKKHEPELVPKQSSIIHEELRETISPNQLKVTYFVHGTTTDNENGLSTGWAQGELSELGIRQSKELLQKLTGQQFDAIFCSDLKRAVDSAQISFGNKNTIIQDKRLRECNYGTLNQASEEKVIYIDHITQPFPSGESLKEVELRVAQFLNFIKEEYNGKHIAIVAHKAPQLALEVLLNNKSWEQAIKEDWRHTKEWKPGWNYILKSKITPTPLLEIIPPIILEPEKKGFFAKIFSKKNESVNEPPKEVPTHGKTNSITTETNGVENAPPFEEIKDDKSFFGKIKEVITTKTISAEKFEELFWELELALLENNVSIEVIEKIKDDLKTELVGKPLPRDVPKKIEETLTKTIREILTYHTSPLLEQIKKSSKKPFIIAFFGINGAGKTTSIAKLTYYLQKNNFSTVLAACDTFRAAAIQQLEEHANRLGTKIIKHDYGSDAAAVAFDAIKYAEKNKIDVVLIDTAGRLHSNANLMAELEKIIRVTEPDLKIFVGESITGNDCIEQARQFNKIVEMDGVILTKADVDDKGGAPLSIAYTIKKPILFLGMGQEYKDLEPFDVEMVLKNLGF